MADYDCSVMCCLVIMPDDNNQCLFTECVDILFFLHNGILVCGDLCSV